MNRQYHQFEGEEEDDNSDCCCGCFSDIIIILLGGEPTPSMGRSNGRNGLSPGLNDAPETMVRMDTMPGARKLHSNSVYMPDDDAAGSIVLVPSAESQKSSRNIPPQQLVSVGSFSHHKKDTRRISSTKGSNTQASFIDL